MKAIRKLKHCYGILFLSLALVILPDESFSNSLPRVVRPIQKGQIYHGAYADFGALEEEVTVDRIREFEVLAGKKLVWAYFSNHWFGGKIQFPRQAVENATRAGVVPYIRLLPWSQPHQGVADPLFQLDAFLEGKFDSALRDWAREAVRYGQPLILEFCPEVNGEWFPWNGKWNGAEETKSYGDPSVPDGPEKFKDSYIHLIRLFRQEGAFNITWVLHLDVNGTPTVDWNSAYHYDPGPTYIDWIGLSVFGPQIQSDPWDPFPSQIKRFQKELDRIPWKSRPVVISEFAAIESIGQLDAKANWISLALRSIAFGMFSDVIGISYWHSPGWKIPGGGSFRIDSSSKALNAYRKGISDRAFISEATMLKALEAPQIRVQPPEAQR